MFFKRIFIPLLLLIFSVKMYSASYNSLPNANLMFLDQYSLSMPPYGGINFLAAYNCASMYDYVPGKGYDYYIINWELTGIVTQSASSMSSIYANINHWSFTLDGPVFGMGLVGDYLFTYVVSARLTAESTIVINGSKISVTKDVVLNGVRPLEC